MIVLVKMIILSIF